MMNRLSKYVVKHKTLWFIGLSVFLCGIYTVFLMSLNVPTGVVVIVDILLAFIAYSYTEYSPNTVMMPALKELNDNCDPLPLWDVTQKLLMDKSSEAVTQLITINFAVALREMGEYEATYATLKAINIDKTPAIQPVQRAVYYNNLMDVCRLLERHEEADIWYERFLQIYGDVKNKKQRELLDCAVQSAKASKAYMAGEYEKARAILDQMRIPNKYAKVNTAMHYAEIAEAEGDSQEARKQYQFVVDNGNKRYCVQQAQAKLARINL